jgi:hypothetical protein
MRYQLVTKLTNLGLSFKKSRINLQNKVDPMHAIMVYGRRKCIAPSIINLGIRGR